MPWADGLGNTKTVFPTTNSRSRLSGRSRCRMPFMFATPSPNSTRSKAYAMPSGTGRGIGSPRQLARYDVEVSARDWRELSGQQRG
jgi:hypothetical protein